MPNLRWRILITWNKILSGKPCFEKQKGCVYWSWAWSLTKFLLLSSPAGQGARAQLHANLPWPHSGILKPHLKLISISFSPTTSSQCPTSHSPLPPLHLPSEMPVPWCSCHSHLLSSAVPAMGRFLSLSSRFPPRLGSRTISPLSKRQGRSKDSLSWAVWKCSQCFSLHVQRTSASHLTWATRNLKVHTQHVYLSQIKYMYWFHPPNGNIFVLSGKSSNWGKKLNIEVMKQLTVFPEALIHLLFRKDNLNTYTAAAIKVHQLLSQKWALS